MIYLYDFIAILPTYCRPDTSEQKWGQKFVHLHCSWSILYKTIELPQIHYHSSSVGHLYYKLEECIILMYLPATVLC